MLCHLRCRSCARLSQLCYSRPMKDFLTSLLSKKLAVTAACVAVVQSIPNLSPETQALATALISLAYVFAQAYVDKDAK